MWFANFLVAASATMVLPFLSLYIETFGDYSQPYVQKWSGFVFGITFLTAFFISPFWGRFGDKHGYKKILIITGFGISFSIFWMGFVTSVEQLFLLRLLMGVVTGFIPTSLAFISSQTPKSIAGKILGTLQTGTVSGGLFGPLIGGILADNVGFHYTFFITSFLIAGATIIVIFGVKEIRNPNLLEKERSFTRKEVLQHILHQPILLTIMIISLLVQEANFSIQPLLALYVGQMVDGTNLAFLAGIAFSVTGLGNLLATRKWGKLGDKIGHQKVLFLLLILAAIFFIPQAFATTIWQLIIFRFMFGIAVGGLIPCMAAYIRQVAPASIQGEVLGYNVSFRFLGNVIGPVMGGLISGMFGISSVFFVTSGLLLISAGILWASIHRNPSTLKSELLKN